MSSQEGVVGLSDLFNEFTDYHKEQQAETERKSRLSQLYPQLYTRALNLTVPFPSDLRQPNYVHQVIYRTPEFTYQHGDREIKLEIFTSGSIGQNGVRVPEMVEVDEIPYHSEQKRRIFLFSQNSFDSWELLSEEDHAEMLRRCQMAEALLQHAEGEIAKTLMRSHQRGIIQQVSA